MKTTDYDADPDLVHAYSALMENIKEFCLEQVEENPTCVFIEMLPSALLRLASGLSEQLGMSEESFMTMAREMYVRNKALGNKSLVKEFE
jgi:hypothetical protein